jgi:arsenate reductase
MVGRGDTCSYFYAKAYEDWVSDDPAGQDLDHVRHIRQRVRNLMAELTSARS